MSANRRSDESAVIVNLIEYRQAAYNLVSFTAHFARIRQQSDLAVRPLLPSGAHMSGMRNHRRAYNSPTPPLDFAKGRLVYTSQIRSRNRQYRLAAILLVLAVATGVVVVLLANWITTSISR